jgi:hypothetical protein
MISGLTSQGVADHYYLEYNNTELFDFLKEWVEKYYININSIFVNILDNPNMYSLKYIPTWKKKKIQL